MRILFNNVCRIFPSLWESWLFVGKKSSGWNARNEPSNKEVAEVIKKQYYKHDKNDTK